MEHYVQLDLSEKLVLHKDVKVEIWGDGSKIGILLISKGNVEWMPANSKINKRRLSWTKFGELMEKYGKSVRAKKRAKPKPAV